MDQMNALLCPTVLLMVNVLKVLEFVVSSGSILNTFYTSLLNDASQSDWLWRNHLTELYSHPEPKLSISLH